MTLPVRIAMIDTGVNPAHPHVGPIVGGVTISPDGPAPGYDDRLGHGTAIAALLYQQAPEAHLFSVKVFDRTLATSRDTVIRAIDWCLENGIDIINLSLGTANPAHRPQFEAAVRRIQSAGKAIISAYDVNGTLALPGCLPGVIGVLPDPACENIIRVLKPRASSQPAKRATPLDFQDESHSRPSAQANSNYPAGSAPAATALAQETAIYSPAAPASPEKLVFFASPYPREIPGVPRERNLNGVSFAVAHVTAAVARLWLTTPHPADWESTLAAAVEHL